MEVETSKRIVYIPGDKTTYGELSNVIVNPMKSYDLFPVLLCFINALPGLGTAAVVEGFGERVLFPFGINVCVIDELNRSYQFVSAYHELYLDPDRLAMHRMQEY